MCVSHTSNTPKLKALLVLKQTTNHTRYASTWEHVGMRVCGVKDPKLLSKNPKQIKNKWPIKV